MAVSLLPSGSRLTQTFHVLTLSRHDFHPPRRVLAGGLFLFGCLFSWGCQRDTSNASEAARAKAMSDASSDEQSPNASILPEPLAETELSGSSVRGAEASSVITSEPLPRPIPVPWPWGQPLGEDEMKRGVAAGVRLKAHFTWPQSARTVQFGERLVETWPLITIDLLRETATREARQRWVLETDVFPLPRDTELRSRADRLGHVIVWPDARSYRVIPSGALRSLFSDRRADRLPQVEAIAKNDGVGERIGQATRKISLTTPLGTAELEVIEQVDLPSASNMLCRTLFEFIRVEASPELCPFGLLPVYFSAKWQGGGEMQFEVTEMTAVPALDVDGFRAPPILPIFKNGELPPSDQMLFSEPLRKGILPFEAKSDQLIPDPNFKPPVAAEPPLPGTPPVPVEIPSRVKNEVMLINHHDRPMLVLMNRVPLLWLNPGERLPLYVRQEGARIGARDFFGEIASEGNVVTPPRDVPFGQDLVHLGINSTP